jgi:hypothetical protein
MAADLAAHASLKGVELNNAPLHTLAALDAVADAALTRQMDSVSIWRCRLSPASSPALVRLLSSGTLTELSLFQHDQALDGPSAALLGEALRANATLTTLSIHGFLWLDLNAASVLLSALAGHRSVRTLKLYQNYGAVVGPAVGAALGALIAANASELTELNVSHNHLGDAVLRPLLEALPANTHLRTLTLSYNDMSEAFARDVLVPAVRANTSLRQHSVIATRKRTPSRARRRR